MDVATFKESVRARDGYACTLCGMTNAEHLARCGRQLDVHRKVPAKQGGRYVPGNVLTVCRECHGKRHRIHKGRAYKWASVARDVWQMAKTVAWTRGQNPDLLISELCRGELRRMIEEMIASGELLPPEPRP